MCVYCPQLDFFPSPCIYLNPHDALLRQPRAAHTYLFSTFRVQAQCLSSSCEHLFDQLHDCLGNMIIQCSCLCYATFWNTVIFHPTLVLKTGNFLIRKAWSCSLLYLGSVFMVFKYLINIFWLNTSPRVKELVVVQLIEPLREILFTLTHFVISF